MRHMRMYLLLLLLLLLLLSKCLISLLGLEKSLIFTTLSIPLPLILYYLPMNI